MTETVESQLSPPLEANSEVHTFLFADVRGYTRFTQERGDESAAALVAKFLALMRAGVQTRGGQLVEIRGDEALAVFGSARQALRAAIDLQTRFAEETEADPSLPLPVGIGIEMGEAVRFEGGFRGEALNLAARLCNLAQPNEILTTEGVVYLGRRLDGVRYVERGGAVQIKGLDEPVRVLRVLRQDATVPAISDPQRESSLPIGTYLGALPNGVLVGRESEWDHIMEALDEASKGLGRLLLLSGEPGVGKTRLAQEVTLKAQHWGFLVATGRCYEPEQAVPFYPFLEALGAIYNAASASLRAEIPRRWPHLARLLPEHIGAIPSMIHGEEDQQWLFRAVTHLLTTMAEEMPIAILLDDLHWVDDSSLKLIQHLARYTRGSRILLLGTYRDVEIQRQHPLERMLLDLSREGLLDELPIRRLDKKDTASLMSEMLGHDEDMTDLVDLVHERTGGNAFFVQEMVHALVENGSVFRRDGHWERRRVEEMEVPKSIRSVIGQRLSRLNEDGQEVLREASVLGQEFSFDDILELLRTLPSGDDNTGQRWTEDDIDEVLRSAREAGLVREKDGDVFAFNHALTQQTLYAELSTRRRKRLHLAAGRVLERLSEKTLKRRSPELAWHFLEGDDPELAYRYTVMAGEQSEAVFANGEAEKHYRIGLELARELDDEEREAQILERLGGVLTLTAKYDKALDLLERAAKLHAELGNAESERCVLAKIGHAHYQQGSWRLGIERLQPVVTELDSHPDDEVVTSSGYAAVYASLARLYAPVERWREMLAAAERAVELATSIDDARISIGAEITRTAALWELGQEEAALRSIEEVIPRAEAAGDITNLTLAWAYAATYYARRGEFEKDRTYHERALELAERRGDRGQTVLQLMNLSSNYFHIGDWGQAKAYLERAEGIMRDLPVSRMTTWPTAARAFLCLRQGELEEASKHARHLISHAKAMASEDWRRQGLRILAEAALLNQHPAEAQQHLEQALEDKTWEMDPGFLRTVAWAHLEMGKLAKASDMSSRSVAQARAYRDQPELVESLVVRGTVLGRQESWDEAAETFEYALAGAHAMQFPFGEARAMTEYGRLYVMRGSAERGREYLENAIEMFKRLGARRDEALASQSLSSVTALRS